MAKIQYFSDKTFKIFGEDETLDSWLKNDMFLAKKKKTKQNNSAEKVREVKRSKQLDERQTDQIEEDRHKKNTKKNTAWAMNVLRDWMEEKKMATDFDSDEAQA